MLSRDAKVDMVLFPGGYATINGTSVTFHYYTRDYLVNNPILPSGYSIHSTRHAPRDTHHANPNNHF